MWERKTYYATVAGGAGAEIWRAVDVTAAADSCHETGEGRSRGGDVETMSWKTHAPRYENQIRVGLHDY